MKRIFLIEDDKAIAKNLILLLRSEGFTVTHASSRREALAALEGNNFDIALVDISLPDGNGFTICTIIKEAGDIYADGDCPLRGEAAIRRARRDGKTYKAWYDLPVR